MARSIAGANWLAATRMGSTWNPELNAISSMTSWSVGSFRPMNNWLPRRWSGRASCFSISASLTRLMGAWLRSKALMSIRGMPNSSAALAASAAGSAELFLISQASRVLFFLLDWAQACSAVAASRMFSATRRRASPFKLLVTFNSVFISGFLLLPGCYYTCLLPAYCKLLSIKTKLHSSTASEIHVFNKDQHGFS